jgi:hypothetical protein
MTNKELFKQAIAEAKTIREAALVSAKAALEESLAPHVQSMIAAKLESMDTYEDDVKESMDADADDKKGEEKVDEELNLDEFLAELELEEGAKDEEDETEEEEESNEPEEGEEGEEEEGSESIADLTVDELKAIIKDIVDSELEAEEAETPEEEDGEAVHANDTGNNEDSVNLDGMGAPDSMDAEINLEELLAELDALDEEAKDEDGVYEAKKGKKDEKELDEAVSTIEILRNELNEVNLLNAKLLYVNKIFKSKNLSEENKIKVINAFDKATTPNEAKLVFEALNESIDAKETKSVVKEGIIKGFASKPAGNAPNKQIIEINDQVTRMQKLAGITKY